MPPAESRSVNRIVVAMLDGHRDRGFVYNFSPNTESFYLFPTEGVDRSYAKLVEIKDCKAVFFVKTHEGNRHARERQRAELPASRPPRVRGHKMKIVFNDGEELLAASEAYNPTRLGFFCYPLDPRSNNLRIFVINQNVRQVLTGQSIQSPYETARPQARLARSPDKPPPPLPPVLPASMPAPASAAEAEAFPVDKRCEAVLRVIAGESPWEICEELGVPGGVLSYWAQTFLQTGRASLSGETPPGAEAQESRIAHLETRVRSLEEENARLRRLLGSSATPKK
jgi:transposase-like protein